MSLHAFTDKPIACLINLVDRVFKVFLSSLRVWFVFHGMCPFCDQRAMEFNVVGTRDNFAACNPTFLFYKVKTIWSLVS
jgi:hypothetical protein